MSFGLKTTTVRSKPKAFAWSFSKLKNFETCPKRHFHVDIAKDAKEESTETLLWGNSVHEALAKRVGHGTPLPAPMAEFEPLAARMVRLPGRVMVEQKFAINQDFGPCEYFSKDTWFRSVADVMAINEPVAYAGDYKTGKVVEDSVQLAMLGVCIFAHFPGVKAIRTEYLWLKDDAVTRCDIKRSDIPNILSGVMPRVQLLKKATDEVLFPPKPGGLCKKYCPVKQCPHWGE